VDFSGVTHHWMDCDDVRLALTHCDAGVALPRHHHADPFLSFLISGQYAEGHGRQWTDCNENMLTWHPANDQHAVQHGDKEVVSLQMEFPGGAFESISLSKKLPATRTAALMPSLRMSLLNLVDELRSPDPWSHISIRGCLLQVLSAIGRFEMRTGNATGVAVVSRIDAAIAEAFPGAPELDEVISGLGLSVAQAASIYRHETGITISVAIRKFRITRACELLKERDLPLADVALECGFCDQSHFTRSFSRLLKCTPGQYRQSISGLLSI